jgi:uncharacterized protein
MESRIANARALGFASWAAGVWMVSMVYAGWAARSAFGSPVMHVVVVTAMLPLLIAGLASFLRTDHWAAFFFMFWTAVFWAHSAMPSGSGQPDPHFAGWSNATFVVVSLILFLAALRDHESMPVRLLSLGALLVFACLALAAWGLGDFFAALGGYIGLVTALAGFWASYAEAMGGEAGRGGATAASTT